MNIPVTIDLPRPRPTGTRRQRRRQRAEWARKDALLAETVRQRCIDNGLPDLAELSIEVIVQNKYRSQVTMSVSGVAPNYRSMSCRIYLYGINGTSHYIIGHEVAHVRGYVKRYFEWGGTYQPYIDLRFPNGEPRLDTSYEWDVDELIAEDIRVLLGSEASRLQQREIMNRQIAPPNRVEGLRELLSATAKAPEHEES